MPRRPSVRPGSGDPRYFGEVRDRPVAGLAVALADLAAAFFPESVGSFVLAALEGVETSMQ